MALIFLLLAVLIPLFVFGFSGTAHLAFVLRDVEQRRNLLLRVAGFFAMSLWLHALPSILIIIYMRHEGILASEMLVDDEARTMVVGVYAIFMVALLILTSSLGAIEAAVKGIQWRVRNASTLFGWGAVLLFLVLIGTDNWERSLFFLFVICPCAVYLHMVLLTRLDEQIRRYALPFIMIGIVTGALFTFAEFTHQLVSAELSNFRSGGSTRVYVKHKEMAVEGYLILVTSTAAYVRSNLPEKRNLGDSPFSKSCVARIPTAEALIVYRPFLLDTPGKLDGAPDVLALSHERAKMPHQMAELCGTALKLKESWNRAASTAKKGGK